MQLYDLLMLAVLAGATVFGARKGLAWQIASIASLVASYFLALKFSGQIAPMISAEEPWNRFGAMAIVYVVVSAAIWILFRYVSGFIDSVKLADFDRQLGAIFGFIKGVLFCIVITFFAVTLLQGTRDSILQSRSGYYIAVLLDKADPIMPKEVHAVLDPYLNRLEKELEPAKHARTGGEAPLAGSTATTESASTPNGSGKGLTLPPWPSQANGTTGKTTPASPAASLLEQTDQAVRGVQGALEGIKQAGQKWNDLRRPSATTPRDERYR